jgi:hypothetical protein
MHVFQHLLAGSLAGAASTVSMYPLELIKTRMQVTSNVSLAYRSLPSTIRSVFLYEGFYGFYRGMTPAIVASSGSWGGYFYLYELAKKRKLDGCEAQSSSSSKTLGSLRKLNTIDHVRSIRILTANRIHTKLILSANDLVVSRDGSRSRDGLCLQSCVGCADQDGIARS